MFRTIAFFFAGLAAASGLAASAPRGDSDRPLAERLRVTPSVSVPCGPGDLVAYPANYAAPFGGRDWAYTTPVRVVESHYDPVARVLTFELDHRPPASAISELRERLFGQYETSGHPVRLPEHINLKPLELMGYRISIRDGAAEVPVEESDSAGMPARRRSYRVRIPADREGLHRLLEADPKYATIHFRAWYASEQLRSASAEVGFHAALVENLRERITRPDGGRHRVAPETVLVTRDLAQDLAACIREDIGVWVRTSGFAAREGDELGQRALERAERLFGQLRPTRLVDLIERREAAVVWGAAERANDVAAHLQDDFLDRLEEHRQSYRKEKDYLDRLHDSRSYEMDEARFYEDVREQLKGALDVDVVGIFGSKVDLSKEYSRLADDEKKRVRDLQQTCKETSAREWALRDRHDQIKEGQIRASLSVPKDLEIYAIGVANLGALTGSTFGIEELVRVGRVSLDSIVPLGPHHDDEVPAHHGLQVGDVKLSAAPGDQGPTLLVADGRRLLVRDYPALYRKLGRTYCRHPDGRAHDHDLEAFCIPDLRSLVLVGNDDMGTGPRGFDPGRQLGMYQEGSIPVHAHGPGTLTVDTSHAHYVLEVYHIAGAIWPLTDPGGARAAHNALVAGFPYGWTYSSRVTKPDGTNADVQQSRPFEGDNELPRDLAGNRRDRRMARTDQSGDPTASVVGMTGPVIGTRTAEKVRVDNMSVIYLIRVR